MHKKGVVKFDKTESLLLELRQEEISNYIDQCDQGLIRTSIMGYQVEAVFAESSRNELGNALSRKYKDELDFIMIINFARSSFSLRTVNGVDLGALVEAIPGAKGGG